MKNAAYVRHKLIELWFEGFRAGLSSESIKDHMEHRRKILTRIMNNVEPRLAPDKPRKVKKAK